MNGFVVKAADGTNVTVRITPLGLSAEGEIFVDLHLKIGEPLQMVGEHTLFTKEPVTEIIGF